MSTKLKAAWIGLGAMGLPMAMNLNKAGYLAAVWNRSADKCQLFADTGVLIANSLVDLASKADVLFVCVSDDAALLEVVDALLPELTPGQVLVDCSTVAVATAQTVAERLSSIPVDFLDVPVSGGVEGAKQGTLSMMVGGDAGGLVRVMPLMDVMSSRVTHMGPVGSGQATKAANQVMAAGINQAVTQALHLAEAYDLDMDQVVDVLSAGAAGNWFLQHRGKTMVQDQYESGFRVALHLKDLQLCQAMQDEKSLDLPVIKQTCADYEALMLAGHGDEDISALYRKPRFRTAT